MLSLVVDNMLLDLEVAFQLLCFLQIVFGSIQLLK